MKHFSVDSRLLMRIFRFKLRTLLIATMFVAATLGFAIKLVLDVGQERKAVERLRDNWLVQTSLGYQNYLVQDQGAWETVPLWADKKIYGGDGRPRCRILSIYNQSGNDSQSAVK